MYKIAVIGDYDSIYGFATLGLSICPVKTREDARKKLKQLADGQYGIIYITEAVAAQIEEEIEQYRENMLPAIIQIPGVSGNTGAVILLVLVVGINTLSGMIARKLTKA